MDDIIATIYKDCDSTNSNAVRIDSLIEYVRPFMSNNDLELKALQDALDPDNDNPSVSFDKFYVVMSDWIAKIQADNEEAGRFGANNSVSTFLNSFNTSNISITSNSNNNNNMTASVIAEENRKLHYELTKTTTELKLTTQQLIEAEEMIKKLGSDRGKSTKVGSRNIETREKPDEDQLEFDELLEEIDTMKRKNCTLEKMLKSEQKQNGLINNQMLRLENENIKLESQLEKMTKSNHEHIRLLNKLEDTVDEKESEISLYAEIIEDLKEQIDYKSELVSFHLNENQLHKEKIRHLEKLMKEIECGSVQVSSDLNQSLDVYNSPKFLHQIANPVTPSMNSPIFKVKRGSTSSPIKHDSTATNIDSCSEPQLCNNLCENLKDELTNVLFSEDSREEVKRLQSVLNEEENIKKCLFQGVKRLSIDIDSLQNFKQKYEDLQKGTSNYESIIADLKNKLLDAEVLRAADKNCVEANMIGNELEHYKMQLKIEQDNNVALIVELDELKGDICKLTNEVNNMELKLKENTLLQLREAMEQCSIDKSCQTDFAPKASDSQKTNFAKQQIRLDRLNERIGRVENELLVERNINTNLERKRNATLKQVEALIVEIESHKKKYIEQTELISSLLTEKIVLFEKTVLLEAQIKNAQNDNEILTEEMKKLVREKDISNQNLQHALARLSTESLQTVDLRKQNETLFLKISDLEQQLKLDFIKQVRLRKRLIDLTTVYTRGLQAKCFEINNLRKKTEVDSVLLFLSTNNKDLTNGLLKVVKKFNLDDEMHEFLNETSLENKEVTIDYEMEQLSTNVKWVLLMFHIFEAKFFRQIKAVLEREGVQHETYCVLEQEADDTFDKSAILDDVVLSVLDDPITLNENEVQALIPGVNDSFLDNLELNDTDLRLLSQKEMEDKFTALVLSLTIDIPTSTSRLLNEKAHLERLLVKYFAYLKYNIDLLSSLNLPELNTATNCLQILKNSTEDVLKSAVSYGVLQYEKRTVNCWHLVTNYVASLSRELKELREIKSNKIVGSLPAYSQLNGVKQTSRSSFLGRIKFYVFLFLFVFVILAAILFFYVDSMCPRDVVLCPLESVLNFVIDRNSIYRI